SQIPTLWVKHCETSSQVKGVGGLAEKFFLKQYKQRQEVASRGFQYVLDRMCRPVAHVPTPQHTGSQPVSDSGSLVLDFTRELHAREGVRPAHVAPRFLPRELHQRYMQLLRRALSAAVSAAPVARA